MNNIYFEVDKKTDTDDDKSTTHTRQFSIIFPINWSIHRNM